MIGKRTNINLAVFLALSVLLAYLGMTQLVLQKGGGRTLRLDFADASGLATRNDVTMRGVPVGAVKSVTLTPQGIAQVIVQFQPGIVVPGGTKAQITRRSPIGDLTLELTPGTGPALATGATIGLADTASPPDPEKTIQALADVLKAVPSQDLGQLVSELAVAVQGRSQDMRVLTEASADLPERILQVRDQLQALIQTGQQVTGVFAANSQALADDFTQTALLAQILDDRRYDLVNLSKNGASFAQVANDLIGGEKPNIACLIADFGNVNTTIASPPNLRNLESALELNHYFFDGVWQVVQTGSVDHQAWFRVHLLPPQAQNGRPYQPQRPPPNVYGADACHSRYGSGVGRGSQPGPLWVATGSTYIPGKK